jgi:hypothetical protein
MDFVFRDENTLRSSMWKRTLWQIQMRLAVLAHRARTYFDNLELMYQKIETLGASYAPIAARERLPEEAVQEITDYYRQVHDTADNYQWRRDFYESGKSFQSLVIPLVEAILARDDQVKSVLNVGVRYAFPDHELAARFPQVQFYGIDFMPDLLEMNRQLSRENLHFMSGYPLDLMERGQARGDVVLFSSTATLIANPELRAYLRLIADNSRYVVFNEPIFTLLGGNTVNPDRLPLGRSVPVHLQPGSVADSKELCMTHNYRAMLREAGFKVIHFHLFRPEWTDMHIVNLIGARPGTPLTTGKL